MPRSLRISILFGIFSTLVGCLILAHTFDFYLKMPNNELSEKSLAKVGVILIEMLCSLAFSFFAFLLWHLKTKSLYIAVLGVLRLLIFMLFMFLFWENAWFYILDLNGSQPFSFLLLFLSIGQILGLIVMYRYKY